MGSPRLGLVHIRVSKSKLCLLMYTAFYWSMITCRCVFILRNMLTEYVDLQIVGEACDGKQAIEQAAACQPDIILMDYYMSKMNGIEAARLMKKSWERQSSLDMYGSG